MLGFACIDVGNSTRSRRRLASAACNKVQPADPAVRQDSTMLDCAAEEETKHAHVFPYAFNLCGGGSIRRRWTGIGTAKSKDRLHHDPLRAASGYRQAHEGLG